MSDYRHVIDIGKRFGTKLERIARAASVKPEKLAARMVRSVLKRPEMLEGKLPVIETLLMARAGSEGYHPILGTPYTTFVRTGSYLTDSQVKRIHELAAESDLNLASFLNTAFELGLAHADEIAHARKGRRPWLQPPREDTVAVDDDIPF